MHEFTGRVAVVTGAASGIGLGLARRFAEEGMKVVLADVEQPRLDEAAGEMEREGHRVLGVVTDVSSRASVDALADAAYERFGAVHVLCNNAGVGNHAPGPLWETTANDWTWVVGVNLMGVVHGVQAFVPRMIAAGDEGHIVNTSSVLGLSTGAQAGIYSVTKHAVTRFTEGLYYDLRTAKAPIGVSVLCPGLIATRIVTAERNRPEDLRNGAVDEQASRLREMFQQHFLENGMAPATVAEIVVDAIRNGEFYVFTHPEMERAVVMQRMRAILDNQLPDPPTSPTPGGMTPG